MPHAADPLPPGHVPAPKPIRWTRQQCNAMRESGVLTERYELVDGEITLKIGQNRPHALVIVLLTEWLTALFGARFVQIQLPILLAGADRNYSEPEPDAVVLTRPATDFPAENPDATNVALVIEVSDSSLRFDRATKASLYARNNIPEYWVVDIDGRQIIAHRQPAPNGYAGVLAFTANERIAPLARPTAAVEVAALLPPQ